MHNNSFPLAYQFAIYGVPKNIISLVSTFCILANNLYF